MLLKGSAALIVGSAQGLGLVCAKASYIADETIYIDAGRLNLNLYFFCDLNRSIYLMRPSRTTAFKSKYGLTKSSCQYFVCEVVASTAPPILTVA